MTDAREAVAGDDVVVLGGPRPHAAVEVHRVVPGLDQRRRPRRATGSRSGRWRRCARSRGSSSTRAGELAQRDPGRLGRVAGVPLVGLAHVEEQGARLPPSRWPSSALTSGTVSRTHGRSSVAPGTVLRRRDPRWGLETRIWPPLAGPFLEISALSVTSFTLGSRMIAESEKPPSGTSPLSHPSEAPTPLIHGRRFPLGPRRTAASSGSAGARLLLRRRVPPWRRRGTPSPRRRPARPTMAATRRSTPRNRASPSEPARPEWAERAERPSEPEVEPDPRSAERRGQARARATSDASPSDRAPTTTSAARRPGPAARDRGRRPDSRLRPTRTVAVPAGDTTGRRHGTSVDTPSAPVEAPAATASGPAPDAVAAAPIVHPGAARRSRRRASRRTPPSAPRQRTTMRALRRSRRRPRYPRGRGTGRGPSLAGLPGARLDRPADARRRPTAPSAARRCSRPAPGARSPSFLALLAAIVLFLAIHRRVDRSDPKLAAAHAGPTSPGSGDRDRRTPRVRRSPTACSSCSSSGC